MVKAAWGGTKTSGTFPRGHRVLTVLAAALLAFFTTGAAPAATVTNPLKVTTATLPGAGFGKKYAYPVQAQGGHRPYAWLLVSGALPPGMRLTTSGWLKGAPKTSGNFPFEVEVTDSSHPRQTATAQLTFAVAPAPLRVTTKSLPGGATEALYNAQLEATGGTPPYTWKWVTGQLPPGVTLSTTGVLSGTPTGGGIYHFGVEVTDSASTPQSVTAYLHVVVTTTPLVIGTKSIPGATLNSGYSATLTASGGVPPYTWNLDTGQLPNGVTLSSGGVLSGTPSVPGTFTFKVKVNDSSPTPQAVTATFKLVVAPVPLSITTNSLPGGIVGSSYSEALAATGGTTPYTWTLASGALPPGVTMSSEGAVTGTPTQPGTFHFTVRATDSSPKPESARFSYSLVVAPVPLLVATTGLPAATQGSPYTAVLTTSGGTAPYTWSKSAGKLPPGIVLSAGGNLFGVARAGGTYTFTVRAQDSSPTRQTANAVLTLIVGNGPTSWSGYIRTGSFSSVTGTFTVPATVGEAQGQISPAAVSEWVGFDGVTGKNVIRAGVTEYFGGPATITPWWGTGPAQVPIVMTVQAGDSITVTIFRIARGTWAITLDDNTSKQDFRTEHPYAGPASAADYVVTAPSVQGKISPLASYSPTVNFTNLQTIGRQGATAAVVLVQNGVQVSTPSTYSSSSFAVSYGSVAPPPPPSPGQPTG